MIIELESTTTTALPAKYSYLASQENALILFATILGHIFINYSRVFVWIFAFARKHYKRGRQLRTKMRCHSTLLARCEERKKLFFVSLLASFLPLFSSWSSDQLFKSGIMRGKEKGFALSSFWVNNMLIPFFKRCPFKPRGCNLENKR